MSSRRFVAVAATFLVAACSSAPPRSMTLKEMPAINTDAVLADTTKLSSDEFGGRKPGTRGEELTVQYLTQQFKAAGAEPGNPDGTWTQKVPMVSLEATDQSPLVFKKGSQSLTLKPHDDVVAFSQRVTDTNAVKDSDVVFVGYGIVDPAQEIDDYAGVDVKNCIVLFLRGKPDHYPSPVSHADKVRFARDRGALAYLTATGPIFSPYEIRRGVTGRPSALYGQLSPDQALPGACISTKLAETLLAGSGDESNPDHLRTLQEQLNNAPSARSRLVIVPSSDLRRTDNEGM